MKIRFAKYKRKLKKPFSYGSQEILFREGIYIEVDGFYSEASPLKGHSIDTIEQNLSFLENSTGAVPPAMQFAIQGILAQKKLAETNESLFHRPIFSNALIPLVGERTKNTILSKFEEGYRTFKFKINSSILNSLFALLREVKELLPRATFRLDANQSLDSQSLLSLFRWIEKEGASQIEYIEEPLKDSWSGKYFQMAPIPIAADESANSLAEIEGLRGATRPPDIFIVKPSIMGGLCDFPAIYTSAIESEAGRRSILALLLLKQKQGLVAGLSTGFLFEENFLPDISKYEKVPPVSDSELKYLQSLDWSLTEI